MRNDIERYWHDLERVAGAMPFGLLESAAEALLACHRRRGTVFVLGNGGSAATASHFVCDLAKGTRTDGFPAFRVVSVTDNMPLMTAWANDTSYDRVFAEQLSALVRPGDVVVALSSSGNSPNVLAATRVARQLGATTIALTGQSGGRLGRLAELTIRVPASSVEQVEDAHLAIAHSLCVAIRERLRATAHAGAIDNLSALEDALAEPVTIDYSPPAIRSKCG
jgi:D-sedoheptulose 7-phosphate isomerase